MLDRRSIPRMWRLYHYTISWYLSGNSVFNKKSNSHKTRSQIVFLKCSSSTLSAPFFQKESTHPHHNFVLTTVELSLNHSPSCFLSPDSKYCLHSRKLVLEFPVHLICWIPVENSTRLQVKGIYLHPTHHLPVSPLLYMIICTISYHQDHSWVPVHTCHTHEYFHHLW